MSEQLKLLDIFYGLIKEQSDTGTSLEINAAKYLYSIIEKDSYFKNHTELYGKYTGNDYLKRPVIWALKKSNSIKGKANKTIILAGHYDCVEIDCYGELREFALMPKQLKEKMLLDDGLPDDVKIDLNSDKWVFGRGVNDMKAGLAINLNALLNARYDNLNVLFIAVPDEENLSSGMRDATAVLSELKIKYELKYEMMLLTEPHMGKESDSFRLYTGTVGKIMPAIVAKGILGHGSEVMSSLNASYILSEIISACELNEELCSIDGRVVTQPPTVLYARDQKEFYNVSVTEYAACYMNYQFLETTSIDEITSRLEKICEKSINKVINKYDATFKKLCDKGFIQHNKKANTGYRIMTYSELINTAKINNSNFIKDIEEYKKHAYTRYRAGEINIQQVSIDIMRKTIELSNINSIVIVIGFIPPYYPAVKNDNVIKYTDCINNILYNEYNMMTDIEPYFMGISDISYTKCTDYKQQKLVMENMICDKQIYDINFEEISELSFPSIVLGPLGKDYHTKYERVLIDDVTEKIPQIIDNIMRQMDNE